MCKTAFVMTSRVSGSSKNFLSFQGVALSRSSRIPALYNYNNLSVHTDVMERLPKYQLAPHLPPGTISEPNIYMSVGKFETLTSPVLYLPTSFWRRTQAQI
jgi:hypothetical protein